MQNIYVNIEFIYLIHREDNCQIISKHLAKLIASDKVHRKIKRIFNPTEIIQVQIDRGNYFSLL